jgi:pyruvate,orthophosphate dikinase
MEDRELAVLRAVRLRLVVRADQVAAAAGEEPEAAEARLGALAAAGSVTGTPRGWRLTPEGQSRLDDLLRAEQATVDAAGARSLHDDFLAHDRRLKELVTDHQVAGADPEVCHAAAADVAERLSRFHADAAAIVGRAVSLAPRLAPYRPRLDRAAAAVAAGDTRYVAHPLVDSYHSVWFELHEELLHLARLSRADLPAETDPAR